MTLLRWPMILALILADKVQPLIDARPPFLLPLHEETALERLVRVVLRGPFGGTIVAADAAFSADVKNALSGFVVQHVALPSAAQGTVGALAPALKFAEEFRARWERAMAAANARFKDESDDDGDDNDDDTPAKNPKGPPRKSQPGHAHAPQDWGRHSKNADVKIRGLARSFERDGVMLFRAERPLLRPELQAQLVEAFARESADKRDQARPFAQAVHQGVRAYPVLLSRAVIPEITALPPSTLFDDWLLNQLKRIQDVQVEDAGVLESLSSAEDYERIKRELE